MRILPGACVRDSVLMGNTVISEGATVEYAILDENVTIGAGAKIGAPRGYARDITVIGAGVTVPSEAVIPDGDMISSDM